MFRRPLLLVGWFASKLAASYANFLGSARFRVEIRLAEAQLRKDTEDARALSDADLAHASPLKNLRPYDALINGCFRASSLYHRAPRTLNLAWHSQLSLAYDFQRGVVV